MDTKQITGITEPIGNIVKETLREHSENILISYEKLRKRSEELQVNDNTYDAAVDAISRMKKLIENMYSNHQQSVAEVEQTKASFDQLAKDYGVLVDKAVGVLTAGIENLTNKLNEYENSEYGQILHTSKTKDI